MLVLEEIGSYQYCAWLSMLPLTQVWENCYVEAEILFFCLDAFGTGFRPASARFSLETKTPYSKVYDLMLKACRLGCQRHQNSWLQFVNGNREVHQALQ